MTFSQWLDEIEVFSMRRERLYYDFSQLKNLDGLYKWLEAAYAAGQAESKAATLEEMATEIEMLQKAMKVQAAAVKTLQACEESQINVLRRDFAKAHYAVVTLDSERAMNEILTEENERLRKALSFYADPANYIGRSESNSSVYIETSVIDTDNGARARKEIMNE